MDHSEALQLLKSIGESHILKWWDTLDLQGQNKLIEQISFLDIDTLKNQKKLINSDPAHPSHFEPFTKYFLSGNQEDIAKGKALIAEGKAGCLIIAGGQGTRLGFNGPKGIFPVSPILHKSLFQIFAEKIVAAGIQAGRPLPLAIMTSPQNHAETVEFFHKHNNFGLAEEQLTFFIQGELPFLNEHGHLFLETTSQIALGPDGNGGALETFYQNGPGKQWEADGIKYLTFIVVDNPLADPFDAELIGHHARLENEITVKCTKRNDPEEKVGVLGHSAGHTTVIEYSELPTALRSAINPNGSLQYGCANLSLFCFSMNFIKDNIKKMKGKMPLHKAFKATKYLSDDGKTIQPATPNAWKFEKFIFDILALSKHVSALLYPREHCFAPLKNAKGPDSLETVSKALQDNDRKTIESITGKKIQGKEPIEIEQQFYYPTPELLQDWKGKEVQGGVVTH